MFAKFEDVVHFVKMNNLFVAKNLAIELYSLPARVGIHGVIIKNTHGVHPCVIKEDTPGKKAKKVREIVKSSLLKGDRRSSNLIVASCFYQKPLYMLLHSEE